MTIGQTAEQTKQLALHEMKTRVGEHTTVRGLQRKGTQNQVGQRGVQEIHQRTTDIGELSLSTRNRNPTGTGITVLAGPVETTTGQGASTAQGQLRKGP